VHDVIPHKSLFRCYSNRKLEAHGVCGVRLSQAIFPVSGAVAGMRLEHAGLTYELDLAAGTAVVGVNDSAIGSVTISSEVAHDGTPYPVVAIGEYAFAGCSGITSVAIPGSVASIGRYAFSHCSGLTSVDIPDSVTSITDGAFGDCLSLTSVIIPDSVTSIGDYAFGGCSDLSSVTIPDSVVSIGMIAFSECFGLTEVIIPRSVMSIGACAFDDSVTLIKSE
jgi:hypothetical protein